MRRLSMLFLASVFFAAPAFAVEAPAAPVVIMNTGSTNMSGYRAEVMPDGTVRLYGDTGMTFKAVPASLARKLFDDIQAAGKLSALPRRPCMKSASFGSGTTIGWKGQETPDLSCPNDNKAMQMLYDDVQQIVKTIPIAPGPRRFLNLPKR